MKRSALLFIPLLSPTTCFCQDFSFKNVIVILADDHARNVTGCYGNDIIRTPNIDKLAKDGIIFDRAYCNAPISSASRASLLTGKYPHSTKSNLLFTPFDDVLNVTIAEILREKGYRTALIGKSHFNDFVWSDIYKEKVPDHGFSLKIEKVQYNQHITENRKRSVPDSIETYKVTDSSVHEQMNARYLPEKYFDDDASGTFFAQSAVKFINDNRENPFFLLYAPHEPHHPYLFPVEYRNRYHPNDMILPQGSPEDDRWVPHKFRNLTDKQKKGIIAAYYTSVEYMDKNVGIVMEAIKKAGLEKKTLIVYISDNGYLLYEHKRFEKHTMWEEAVRQPLIIKGNGLPEGIRCGALVEYIDIVPTILDLLRVNSIPSIQGKSFRKSLINNDNHKKSVFSFYLEDNFAMICNKNWKYIFHTGARDLGIGYYTSEGAAGITHFLYNLENDPTEKSNLAYIESYREIFKGLRKELLDHFMNYHPESSQLPDNLNIDGMLVWFCEPRDIGALPNLNDKPIPIFYNKHFSKF